jgi:hypothetical protein
VRVRVGAGGRGRELAWSHDVPLSSGAAPPRHSCLHACAGSR